MADIWDKLEQDAFAAKKDTSGGDIWDKLERSAFGIEEKPATRNPFAVANDTVITAANYALGGVQAISDFASPGNQFSQGVEALIKEGEEKQSNAVKLGRAKLGQALESDSIGTQLKGVKDFVLQNPLQAAAMAAGSFAIPGGAIKGTKLLGGALGLAEKTVGRLATGSGMVTSGALAGGDAAGDAYQTVMSAPELAHLPVDEREKIATDAARKASAVPFVLGAASGMFGAEKALATGTKSILKTAASEFLSEAIEEGGTKLSANIAAQQAGADVGTWKGVAGSAALGGVLGGGTGLATGMLTKQPDSLLANSNNISTGNIAPDENAMNKAIDANSSEVSGQTTTNVQLDEIKQQQAELQRAQEEAKAQAAAVAAEQEKVKHAELEQEFKYNAAKYGITPLDVANQYRIGNKQFFNTAQAQQFIQGMEELNKGLGDELKFMIGAAVNSGALKIDQKATPKSVNNAAVKFLSDYGLADSTGVDDAVGRVESIISTLEGPKALKEADVLNNFYKSITGNNSPAFDKLVTAAQEQPKLTKGASNEQLQLQQQGNARVREVPIQGGPTETSGTGTGNVRSAQVQSIGTGSVGAGPLGLQTGAVPGEGVSTSTSTGGAVSGSRDERTGQGQGQVSSEREDALRVINQVITRAFGERDAKIVLAVLDKNQTQAEIAKEYGLSDARVNQIAGPQAQETWGARILLAARNMGISKDEMGNLLEKLREEIATEEQVATEETLSEVPSEETSALNVDDVNVATSDEDMRLGREEVSTGEEGGPSGFRVFNPDVSGQTELEDASAKNRTRRKLKTTELKNLKDFELNNLAADENTTPDELGEIVDELMRRQEVRVAKGESSAVQKQSTSKGNVRKSAGNRKEVGEANAKPEEPARTRKEGQTDEEAAAEAWNEGIKDFPQAPKFEELTEEQQDDWISYGEENWTPEDVQTELIKLAKSPEYSKTAEKGEGSNAEEIRKEIKDFIGGENVRRVEIFQSIKDLPLDAKIAANPKAGDQAFVWKNKAYLIADNIKPGTARAVFMHEVGSHLGIQKMLTEKQFDHLVDSVLAWSKKDDGSIESVIAKRALQRSAGAEGEQANTELIAYFIEEAMLHNIDPTATKPDTALGRWFRSLWAAFKTAIRRLNMFDVEKLNAQDVVNIAYGAARLEVAGTWHGTAASFRKFNHKYMGTGEGAQAFGWGTYLAQKAGIAHQYWKTDVKNKTKDVGYRYKGRSVKEMRRYEMQNLGRDIENRVALDVIREMKKPVSAMMGLSVKNRTPLQAIKDEIAAWQKRIDNNEIGTLSGANQAHIDALKKLNPLDFSTVTENVPGSLMRVDINATPDELLDLDKPIKEQKAIQDMLAERMHKDVQEALVDETNQDIADMTGHDLYFGLKSLELRDGMLSGLLQTFEGVNKADEAVSKYLYELGIKGNQFKDATSRKNTPEEKATKNIVMFNDEDIFRALSLVGADTEKVQYSKKAINKVREETAKRIAKMPKPIRGPLQHVADTTADFAKKGLPYAAFTEDLADVASKYIPSAKTYVNLMKERQAIRTKFERRVDEILQAYDKLPTEVKGTGEKSVNKFLMDSTREEKWAYNPGWIKDFDETKSIDPALKERFEALPAPAQEVVKAVFAHGQSTLQAMQKAVTENINTEYDALIAAAKQAGDTKEEQELTKKKANSLVEYATLMRTNSKKPYAPLKRFGNYVVVGKSQQYLDNEKIVEDETSSPDAKAEARKKLRELEKNDLHYFVQFAETVGEAKAIVREEAGNYDYLENFEKDTSQGYGLRDLNDVFNRLRNMVQEGKDAHLTEAAEKTMNRLMADLKLTLLSETSARNSERRRKNIGGAEKDMMRAFATQGRATANFISSMENSGNIYDTLRQMKKETDAYKGEGTREERRRYYNEFMKRHFMGMDYQPSPFVDKALSATSMWMLLTNPSYYLQNMTQPFMMSLPVIGGKHGYARSWKEMTRAYGDIASVIRKHGLTETSYNKLPEDVRNVVEVLVNRGRIDISLEQDLGRWRSTEDSKLAKFGRASELLRGMAQDIETINRVATAVAAYRLEVKASNPTNATNYADKIIYTTHGDYSSFNAPRITRSSLGRLATQFRKFQLIQISLMARLFNDAFAHEDPAVRLIGKKSLAYTIGHTAVMGGIMGLPGFYAIAALYGMLFGDADEPDNPELALRKAIGDETIADLLLKGVPAAAGVDVSGKLGMGQMLSVLPYTDVNLSRKGVYETIGTIVSGPFGGLLAKSADGVSLMASGDYQKGLEQLLPTGLANVSKAYRYGTEGVTTRAGDVVLNADDIGLVDQFFTALGLPTDIITDRNFLNAAKFEYDQFYNDKASEIKRAYTRAYKEGDTAALNQAREDWKALQESRARNGYQRQPLSNLLKAPQEQRKRERQTAGGVQFNKANRGFVKTSAGL